MFLQFDESISIQVNTIFKKIRENRFSINLICCFKKRTPIEQLMSTEMTRLAKKYATKFQLALGDNFYFKGVTDVNDKRFKVCRSQIFVRHLDKF